MKYSNLVNALAALVGANARTSTRTNYPYEEEKDHPTEVTFGMTRTEVHVVGYDGGSIGFTLRAMELSNETIVPTKEKALQMVKEDDPTFKQFFDDTSNSTLLDVSGALDHAGMSNNYFRVLRDIVKAIDGFAVKDRGPTLLGASKQVGNGVVAFFVQLEHSTVILQIMN